MRTVLLYFLTTSCRHFWKFNPDQYLDHLFSKSISRLLVVQLIMPICVRVHAPHLRIRISMEIRCHFELIRALLEIVCADTVLARMRARVHVLKLTYTRVYVYARVRVYMKMRMCIHMICVP